MKLTRRITIPIFLVIVLVTLTCLFIFDFFKMSQLHIKTSDLIEICGLILVIGALLVTLAGLIILLLGNDHYRRMVASILMILSFVILCFGPPLIGFAAWFIELSALSLSDMFNKIGGSIVAIVLGTLCMLTSYIILIFFHKEAIKGEFDDLFFPEKIFAFLACIGLTLIALVFAAIPAGIVTYTKISFTPAFFSGLGYKIAGLVLLGFNIIAAVAALLVVNLKEKTYDEKKQIEPVN